MTLPTNRLLLDEKCLFNCWFHCKLISERALFESPLKSADPQTTESVDRNQWRGPIHFHFEQLLQVINDFQTQDAHLVADG